MIMAKTVGWDYLASTEVEAVKRQVTAAAVTADDKSEIEEPPVQPLEQQEFMRLMDQLYPGEKPRKKLTDRQTTEIYRTGGLRNIQAVAKYVTSQDTERYRDWYRQAHEDCRKAAKGLVSVLSKFQDPLRVFIGVVAATSQRTLWESNLELASQVIMAGAKKSIDYKLPITDDNLEKAGRILEGDFSAIESDAKFGPFNRSLLDPEATAEVIVVDTHMIGMWLGRRYSVQDPKFKSKALPDAGKTKVAVDTARVAREMGLTNQSAQAVLWSVWRKLPPGYHATELQFRDDRNPEFDLFQALYPYIFHEEGRVWGYKPYRTHQDDEFVKDLKRRWRQIKPDEPRGPGRKLKEEDPVEYEKQHKLFVKERRKYQEIMRQVGAIEDAIQGRGIGPDEWDDLVGRYGTDLYRFYGISKKTWEQFMSDHPEWRARLSRSVESTGQMVADLLERAAGRIVQAGPDPVIRRLADEVRRKDPSG
jgi:hypothetical protein